MFAFQKIKLPKEQMESITKYENSFGKEWVERAIAQNQIREYLKTNLVLILEESKFATPYNCYNTGHEVYQRIDGDFINQDDIDALTNMSSGQGNKVIGKVGDKKVIRDWFCDSSD